MSILPYRVLTLVGAIALTTVTRAEEREARETRIVGHRGFFKNAPENTLAGFATCCELRLGIELDVRRTSDGHLVCLHDDDVKRTTNGKGKVADMTLAEVRKLDAGGWYDDAFAGERVPLLEEVFELVKQRKAESILIALDLKIDDGKVEADVVALAKKHGILSQVMFIGTTISDPQVRKRLRAADAKTPVAVLAQKSENLAAAIADPDADWDYARFVPTADEVNRVHQAGKRIFLVGTTVAGIEPENWRKARLAGVDALLTDFPLECRRSAREGRLP